MIPNPCFTWFTYSGDQNYIYFSIVSIKNNFPDAKLFVVDDHLNPMPSDAVKRVQALGAEYSISRFQRNKNLNGKECCIGIVNTLEYNAKLASAEFSIKIDSDTYLNNLTIFKDFDGEKNDGFRLFYNNPEEPKYSREAFGMFYAIRTSKFSELRDYLMLEAVPPEGKSYWPEDIMILRSLDEVGNLFSTCLGFCGLYFLEKQLADKPPHIILKPHSILHFGDRRDGISERYVEQCLGMTFKSRGWLS